MIDIRSFKQCWRDANLTAFHYLVFFILGLLCSAGVCEIIAHEDWGLLIFFGCAVGISYIVLTEKRPEFKKKSKPPEGRRVKPPKKNFTFR